MRITECGIKHTEAALKDSETALKDLSPLADKHEMQSLIESISIMTRDIEVTRQLLKKDKVNLILARKRV